jgi:hypothetical protein
MNNPTAEQLSQSFQHCTQAAAYAIDVLITFTDCCTIVQEMDEVLLDMDIEA